ncbi:hypothetical protein [Lysinibacillus sp. BPa_S21]|uniref:hypothetical protein n=1 Tax=Lysinibacillus sp. BPa_S21 TaxID=2932478 RepID=UPI0020126A2A|nr:hypothetical protein [Lysinibacillus sp. BPa_S21]MCL1695157.1 hypothetical protein [Lysinibacillus sp. BPa_S21]
MKRNEELVFISTNTSDYLEVKGKSLEKKIEEIQLTEQTEKDIVASRTKKTVIDKGLSLFGPLGDVISTVLNWNEEVNQDISEAKKMILISKYIDKVESQENAINKLQKFLVNPQGNTLFNKILRILDESPPDEELAEYLSSTLKYIIEKERFEELFEQHKYALAYIEKLTPQALAIIADYQNWPTIKLGSSIHFGPKITSDWYSEFTQAYCSKKRINNQEKYKRVQHSVIELQRQGIMEAFNGEIIKPIVS